MSYAPSESLRPLGGTPWHHAGAARPPRTRAGAFASRTHSDQSLRITPSCFDLHSPAVIGSGAESLFEQVRLKRGCAECGLPGPTPRGVALRLRAPAPRECDV